ncbi:glycosyltransferase family 9 protein [Ilyomonas limi]|uniref:Glycosyltransferase family 9 protein n=1 Tax=Ilyomonas limi TaxID=2575867 RepID=A0A4U3L2J7_9BACT|nr:glycosyltransferase family 9 protein [Ilyomonas limi]TKK69245.1 glycosyltransferase family 9 protein [Ilyomonas limi]
MSAPKHILVFRFSSLGDIAMTVPVIKLLLQQHPQVEVTFVSVAFVQPLFNNIERLRFYAADIRGKYKGVAGLYRLYKELNCQFKIDAVADLHNVLRTQVLRVYFFATGKKIVVIDKGREEKKKLTRGHNKVLKPLKSTFQRYADVFAALDLPITLNIEIGIIIPQHKNALLNEYKQQGYKLIGIAPFAQYSEKTYPANKMQQVIQLLAKHKDVKIFLFGGKSDVPALQQLETINRDKIQSLAGAMPLAEELDAVAQLDIMVSMDSANMHLASLFGIPVISVWGGTHPYLGFYGWGQPLSNAVQVELDCRPSSVFGNKPCPRGDLACMNRIAPLMIYNKICEVLSL